MLYVNIKKKYRDFTLEAELEAEDEIIGLLGSSGSGKSLTLKSIAGIVMPDEGEIVIDGRQVFSSAKGIKIPARDRRVGYLFQNYALFPRMTVLQNITCCLRKSRKENLARAEELMKEFHLEGLENKRPHQLSGGQQQRAAMARMMSVQPKTILLDEPFSALDTNLKWKLENTLAMFLKTFPGTCVVVTHNKDEAYRLCDKIAVVRDGTIKEFGPKEEIFSQPKTGAAASMLGYKNLAEVQKNENTLEISKWNLSFPGRDRGAVEEICLLEDRFSTTPLEDALAITGKVLSIISDPQREIVLMEVNREEDGILTLEFPKDGSASLEELKGKCGEEFTVYYPYNAILKLRN